MSEYQLPTTSFAGIFSQSIRDEFKKRRLAIGLSLQQLAEFLGIHWSTVRKWENGEITSCHPCHVARIDHFLNGDYDRPLSRKSERGFNGRQPSSQAQQLCLPEPLEMEVVQAIGQIILKSVENFYEVLQNKKNPASRN